MNVIFNDHVIIEIYNKLGNVQFSILYPNFLKSFTAARTRASTNGWKEGEGLDLAGLNEGNGDNSWSASRGGLESID